MSDTLLTAIVTAIVTGAVNWGVLSTKLAYMARDIEALQRRMDDVTALHYHRRRDDA